MIAPWAIGRDVSIEEVVKYGWKDGQCGGCDHGQVKVAIGKRSSLDEHKKVKTELVWQLRLCPIAHDRFLRKMEQRLAILETGRVYWQKGLEPENFAFSLLFAAQMLNFLDNQEFDRKYVDKSVYPWVLRANNVTD